MEGSRSKSLAPAPKLARKKSNSDNSSPDISYCDRNSCSGDDCDDVNQSNYTLPRNDSTIMRGRSFSSGSSNTSSIKATDISSGELEFLMEQSDLDEETIRQKFAIFNCLTQGKPSKGLDSEQFFHLLYKRAFPLAVNPVLLSNSVFKLICNEGGSKRRSKKVIHFREFLVSLCVPSVRIPTVSKFRTLFRIWDLNRSGYLTPGVMVAAMRDLYDLLGLLGVRDHHRAAMELFVKMDIKGKCRVRETEFVDVMLSDCSMVNLAERSNFCVPSSDIVYIGQSTFWWSRKEEKPMTNSISHHWRRRKEKQ